MITMRVVAVAAAAALVLSACASNPPRAVKSQFEDIPVAKGMGYQTGESMAIETPTVQAAREVYRGRVEIESLATATRATLEANGWRHLNTTKTSQHGINQVYEKQGTSLQVLLWEGWMGWFTYAEYTTARILQAPTNPAASSR
jgi:hypothetical protein